MKATVPWLAALICAGWLSTPAPAFRGLLRNRDAAEVTVTNQTSAPVSEADNCDPGGHHHGLPGYLHSLPGHSHGCLDRVKGFLLSEPHSHPPAPPKPLPINPYLRSPRDFFMLDDP